MTAHHRPKFQVQHLEDRVMPSVDLTFAPKRVVDENNLDRAIVYNVGDTTATSFDIAVYAAERLDTTLSSSDSVFLRKRTVTRLGPALQDGVFLGVLAPSENLPFQQSDVVTNSDLRNPDSAAFKRFVDYLGSGIPFYEIYVVDPDNRVSETVESNNRVGHLFPTERAQAEGLYGDLRVTQFSPQTANANAGDTISINFTTTNFGPKGSPGNAVGLHLSNDTIITDLDTPLMYTTTPSLLVTRSGSRSVQVRIPPGTPNGRYYLGTLLGGYDSNRTNNSSTDVGIDYAIIDIGGGGGGTIAPSDLRGEMMSATTTTLAP